MSGATHSPSGPSRPHGRLLRLRRSIRLWVTELVHIRDNPSYMLDGRARFRRFRVWLLPLFCLLCGAGCVLGGFALIPVLPKDTEVAFMLRLMLWATTYSVPGMPDVAGWQMVMLLGLWSILSVVAQLIAPAYAATAVTREIERRTLASLLVTPLEARSIVAGKVVAACYPCFLSGLCLIPLFALTACVGGLGLPLTLSAILSMAVCLFSRTAIGVACSAYCRSTGGAIFATYITVLFVLPTIQSILIMPLWLAVFLPKMIGMASTSMSSPFAMMSSMGAWTTVVTLLTMALDGILGYIALCVAQRRLDVLRGLGAQ